MRVGYAQYVRGRLRVIVVVKVNVSESDITVRVKEKLRVMMSNGEGEGQPASQPHTTLVLSTPDIPRSLTSFKGVKPLILCSHPACSTKPTSPSV
ncbi:hypothetical protein Pcinc_036651 [Petrolisthes cinctipes]|uniref:Uncharacterized protein n=1 Tax=Petrolisthes cinctipes TaxID=88211 RepID=A0AAE1BU27_PETCI|nr:hypothetical protein Pcinc_036651 [Petrolisthes cinctipes]